jgi:hypothetical protein
VYAPPPRDGDAQFHGATVEPSQEQQRTHENDQRQNPKQVGAGNERVVGIQDDRGYGSKQRPDTKSGNDGGGHLPSRGRHTFHC